MDTGSEPTHMHTHHDIPHRSVHPPPHTGKVQRALYKLTKGALTHSWLTMARVTRRHRVYPEDQELLKRKASMAARPSTLGLFHYQILRIIRLGLEAWRGKISYVNTASCQGFGCKVARTASCPFQF